MAKAEGLEVPSTLYDERERPITSRRQPYFKRGLPGLTGSYSKNGLIGSDPRRSRADRAWGATQKMRQPVEPQFKLGWKRRQRFSFFGLHPKPYRLCSSSG